jgi:Leucine-rich repeat (LRR) protein
VIGDLIVTFNMASEFSKHIELCRNTGGKQLNLSGLSLTKVPDEVMAFGATLEFLDLGDNKISNLPVNFAFKMRKLRILFFANNNFDSIPEMLGGMSTLYMLSFKGNQVKHISSKCLSPSIAWLILTDNRIEELPPSIGSLKKLRYVVSCINVFIEYIYIYSYT